MADYDTPADDLPSAPPMRVSVAVTRPVAGPFDYRLPEGMALGPGDVVEVPFGPGTVRGVVWDAAAERSVPAQRLKDVIRKFDVPPLGEPARRFAEWVARYNLAPLGAVLRMMLSVPAALEPPKPVYGCAYATVPDGMRMSAARERVLDIALASPPLPQAVLAREAGVGPGVVRGLVNAGALHLVAIETAVRAPNADHQRPMLSAAQASAAAALRGHVEADAFSATLLDGVPGSGKTEVYFEAVAAALARGRQVLVLLPEIALGAQWLSRFEARFGVRPTAWHSDLGAARRRRAWRDVATATAAVVVGARSALFLPYMDLGLIVIDEEHDGAYKQDEGTIYNARDMAVVRAQLAKIPLVLASATPSLETVINARNGRYGRLHLPERHGAAVMPHIDIVDMRRDAPPRGRWIAPALQTAIEKTLAAGEQSLLFLNRRGYAPLTLCGACGRRFQCPACTAWLVEHRAAGRLACHHCGYMVRMPETCPDCEAADTLVSCGPGVERVAEEVRALWPEARLQVASSDTVTGPDAAAELVRALEDGVIDIVVGTQMVAKGYHFPMLTLVGVIDADLGLQGGDLRAGERTYQLLYQVAGRAGRADRPGHVLLQTYQPDQPLIRALSAGSRDEFFDLLSREREDAGMPPFGRLASLIVSGRDESEVEATARDLGSAAPRGTGIQVLGPAPAAMALLRGRHRRRLLLKAARDIRVQPLLRAWLARVRPGPGVRVRIDIDPYSFL